MKAVSKKYSYDDVLLTPKMPVESRFLESFETDLPLFIAPGVFDRGLCDQIVEDVRQADPNIKLTIRNRENDGSLGEVVAEEKRKTFWLPPSRETADLYQRVFAQLKPGIETFFRVRLGPSEGLQSLGYGPGCRYVLHADSCSVKTEENGNWRWEVTMGHRKISTILFLTDSVSRIFEPNQCVGGDVSFDYLKEESGEPLRIKPVKGLFIAFPSTPLFSHQVHEVMDGYRVTFVEWYEAELC